jgi:hypothetical protein
MPNLDLLDDEHAALVRLVKHAPDTDRYPMSPRLYPLRSILEKLDPQPVTEPRPAPKVYCRQKQRQHRDGAPAASAISCETLSRPPMTPRAAAAAQVRPLFLSV